ncbi:MAG: hypothetical protein AAGA47_06425 [Pseudomonadota bacterium]
MTTLKMPPARDFGWSLKPTNSAAFKIHKRENGQFCVVLNHALLRGVRAEMIHWWFLNFPELKVRLEDVPGYEGKTVPGYLLWHPVDHVSATLSGKLGPGNTAKKGCKIHIQEAMQYDLHGLKYPVDAALTVYYVGQDGWAMGKVLPFFGPVMMLRIHFKDVEENGAHVGVHYHYEVVIGVSGNGTIARRINSKITGEYGPEFFAAWERHNVIEVGTFENFLPSLYAQRDKGGALTYARDMDPMKGVSDTQSAHSTDLFQTRVAGYQASKTPHALQAYDKTTFL